MRTCEAIALKEECNGCTVDPPKFLPADFNRMGGTYQGVDTLESRVQFEGLCSLKPVSSVDVRNLLSSGKLHNLYPEDKLEHSQCYPAND